MKKRSKLSLLVLSFLIIFSSCAQRRISYLENRRETFIQKENKDKNEIVNFNPDDLNKFKNMEDYLSWYRKLKGPAKLSFEDKKEKKALSQEEMVEDFNYFFKQIKENYPFFGVIKRQYGIDFLANYSSYLNEIKFCKNDDEFIKIMQKIVKDLKNDHANIADKNYVEDSLDYYSHFWKDPSMYYEFLAMNQESVRDRYNIKGLQSSELSDGNRKRSDGNLIYENDNIRIENIANGIGMIRIKEMLAEYELDDDMNAIDKYLNDNPDLKAIVIDIRDNSGGNIEYWKNYLLPRLINKKVSLDNHMFFKDGMRSRMLLESEGVVFENISNINLEKMNIKHKEDLKDFTYYSKDRVEVIPLEGVKFKGKLYLLVNKGVYSAAEGLANFCKNTHIASIIGEKTGGDGITLGIINDVMPNSGLVFTYTNTLGYAPDGSINEESKTEPDIKAESFNESLEFIKKEENIGN
ncbi:S41 family peptidase [Anaerococcus porci]|uniref:S41 family peptidase n=1 Tax=Anaerococcus porci TaxID=2652269 RepID=UPI002A75E06B|nr:S41 family peptidase [Anaerococcus porci]MDY3005535.1 S41 family peptidase [Anaerococcus porci]